MKLNEFKANILKSHDNQMPKLYICKADIKACFDSINQTHLLEIVENVLNEMEYTISNYRTVQAVVGRVISKYSRTAKHEYPIFNDFIVNVLSAELYNTIIIDGVTQSFAERESLMELLEKHIRNHIIKVNQECGFAYNSFR